MHKDLHLNEFTDKYEEDRYSGSEQKSQGTKAASEDQADQMNQQRQDILSKLLRFKIKKNAKKSLHRLMPIRTIGREDAYNAALLSNKKPLKPARKASTKNL